MTANSYLYRGDHEKWDMMRAWCSWVDEATALAIAADKKLLDVEYLRDFIAKRRYEHKNKKRQVSVKDAA